MKIFSRVSICIALASTILVNPALAADGQFVFTVAGVPPGDKLNVRKLPKATSAIVGKMVNGEQGFGSVDTCYNSKTGKKIPASKLVMSKPNTWCYVVFGDDGQYSGYARAKFLQ